MYRYKNKRVKKGYILLYTMLLGMLCVIISLSCFTFELQVRKNNLNYKDYILKTDISQEYTQNLFTSLSMYINSSVENLTNDNIKSYFSVNYDKFKIIYKKSYIIYDITNDSFIMYSYLDDYYHREDIYSYKVVDGKVCFIYKNTVYNLGKVVT